jgi:hypothetical protein
MATTITIKKKDTFPPLETTLTQTIEGATTPINLTSPVTVKEVLLVMILGTNRYTGACTLVKGPEDAAAGEHGKVRYKWPKTTEEGAALAGNIASTFGPAGVWKIEWQIVWGAGEVESVPNEGQDEITIVAGL